MNAEYLNVDFAFRHHLFDTLLLLGCELEIANLLEKSKDGLVTVQDVDTLRNYNITLFTRCKTALANVHKLKIEPRG